MATTTDDDVAIRYIGRVSSTTAAAYVTFTSYQAAAHGPNGDTEDHWTLDYVFKRVGGQWLIDYAGPHDGSTHTPG
jgi:hypothetical protein